MLSLFSVLLIVGSAATQHSSYSNTTKSRDSAPSLTLNNILKKKARLSLNVDIDLTAMTANEKYLLYFNLNRICLIDDKGNEKSRSGPVGFSVSDVCWSSYLNQFLILDSDHGTAFSLDDSVVGEEKLKPVLDFNKTTGFLNYFINRLWGSCTCYRDTLLVSSFDRQSIVEEYNLSNMQLIRTHMPPISCKADQKINSIRYNSTGSQIGVLVCEGPLEKQRQYFELRESHNMHALSQVELGFGLYTRLLSLPNNKFLVSFRENNIYFLINSDGTLNETINYDGKILSNALINGKCLVVQTRDPCQLHFYDI